MDRCKAAGLTTYGCHPIFHCAPSEYPFYFATISSPLHSAIIEVFAVKMHNKD
ncbi:hypothetical protein RchiOBHm_Chr7g0223191 [Rosa chinensis]|uniref:Uncharacterized protein n=1 Tax=Rosa chinensis TaxID=74649 RepID=A0A2P6PDJ1_ROSCH|nr:hypothetical protein RchiOBHm_Chr7g0223191 [Rosa chinensis]